MRRLPADARRVARRGVEAAVGHPRAALAVLVAIQWLTVLAFTHEVRHDGWLFSQAGDEVSYATGGWFLGHLALPYAVVGHAWSLVLAPAMLATGRDVVVPLPAVILLDVVVLAPVALVCVYAIAVRVAGRALGLFSAALWVAAPFAAIPFFRPDYHQRFVEQFLPQALGLTAGAEFPSMVALLVAAAFVVRALDNDARSDWAFAGLAAGVAAGIETANLLFLGGAALALLVARRRSGVLAFAAGLAPPLVTLALWRYRGLGTIAGHGGVDVDWGQLHDNLRGLREWFWSDRLLEWAPFAGVLAVARRSPPVAALLAGWLALFLVVQGTTAQSSVSGGTFFRYLMPSYPAYFLLSAGIPLLVPRAGIALVRRFPVPHAVPPLTRRVLLAAGVVGGVVPLLAIGVAAARPVSSARDAVVLSGVLTPVDPSIHVSVKRVGARRIVTWNRRTFGRAAVFYEVFHSPPGGRDTRCEHPGAAVRCTLVSVELASTRGLTFVDRTPAVEGLYRVAVAADARNELGVGDVLALSEPAASP